ncbi:hypothetical protein Bca52824_087248 [Brassica carinata]|uniref:Uncharacterized protein n=1 Tax=Brassica carinata TaxID=52824 RepID=A0A8X7TML3_BRACI|nr:hypothetical protein Bca52824_087248 [Brassica carinata]
MVGVGPHSNLQSLDSYITNIRLCLCRPENHVLEVPCANAEFGYPANVTCFAMQRHLMRCVCPFSGCRFIGTYRKLYVHASSGHSDDLQMIECGETSGEEENLLLWIVSSSHMVHISIANSASSELPPEPFVVPSFMGPATEVLILINRVETVS